MNPFPDRIHFSVVFPEIPQPAVEIWKDISHFLSARSCLPKIFEVSQIAGHAEKDQSEQYLKQSPEEFERLLVERNLNGFLVTTGHNAKSIAFTLSNSKNVGPQAALTCRIEKHAKAPDDWSALIIRLLDRFPAVGAWQWGHLYRCWQWNSWIGAGYEKICGKLPSGYRTWHEAGLGPGDPGRTRIDISKNPGRAKELAFRVEFYPTAEMWLGPHFWQYAKCTKEEALAADFFIERRDTPNFLYLKCWPTAFTRPDGEQGRMQQRLWKLFFHEDCEWPPGSGTICDEPMYGPPELMPQPTNKDASVADVPV